MAEPARGRYRITGRVQGVGFRAWTARRALELGLAGLVRNHPDGWVEVEAEGPADGLVRLEELLRRGPPLAHVRGVESLAPTSRALPADFDVTF